MLTLLLDEHISRSVVEGLPRHKKSLKVLALSTWDGGEFLGQPDSVCLEHAAKEGLTLVTYDRRTIPPLLKDWAERGLSHGGVIFVDEKTISPADTKALVRALSQLAKETEKWDWTNRICFLRR
ncbi:MAG: DUF5615 family PIN-like protein [Candidatus Acidiferrum sp.]|jgi:hypothetical protein